MTANIKNDICNRFFLLAYGGWVMPRSIRKLIAGSQIHRAWFLGTKAFFQEAGVWYGLGRSYPEMLESLEFPDSWKREQEFIRNVPSASELWVDQWNDYYEYTGMADLARELRAEEKRDKT